jgi:DNA-binding transcriptional MerR regulator
MSLEPISEVYKKAHEIYHISQRTLQWYATEDLIPKPTHEGKEAFYDIERSKIYVYLSVIKNLKDMYNLTLPKIRRLIKQYPDQIEKLNDHLINLASQYPVSLPLSTNWHIRKKFLELVSESKVDLNDVSLINIQEEIENEEWP